MVIRKNTELDYIGFSTRSLNCLKHNNIYTVGDLLEYDENDLWRIRNLGAKSIEEIINKKQELLLVVTDEDSNPFDVMETQQISGDLNDAFLGSLSPKAYNLLQLGGVASLSVIASYTLADLMKIPFMDRPTADEILERKQHFLSEDESHSGAKFNNFDETSLLEAVHDPKLHDSVINFVCNNDILIEQLGLSLRSENGLLRNGYLNMSDIVLLSREELLKMSNLGQKSVDEITDSINNYIVLHKNEILSFCFGVYSTNVNISLIKNMILKLYHDIGFKGLSFNEIVEQLQLPEEIDNDNIKKAIGSLIADKQLEYVDFRCYRVYESFSHYVESGSFLDARSKDVIQRRLEGETLESIGQSVGLTRERVRQIVKNGIEKTKKEYKKQSDLSTFDEDYYIHLYKSYSFDRKDGSEWFGIQPYVWKYFELIDLKQGKRSLDEALSDSSIDIGLRIKIRNYLNRNKIYIDGQWIEKKRLSLENYVLRKFCKDTVSFEEFVEIYNNYLNNFGLPFDEKIYITEKVFSTRKNRISESNQVLWKLFGQLRYYDIEGQDYTELLNELSLESYRNIEISTSKLMREHPEMMLKYDIRDQYELHNLLRKILPEGSYNNFRLERMPDIIFGTFDRDAALLELLKQNAPISIEDFSELISQEYGYDKGVVQATYLQPLSVYYYQGMFTIEQKVMSPERLGRLKAELTDSFYFIDEVKSKYINIFPDGDTDEINPYNLKKMGFSVYSKYVLQGYDSLESYFKELMTSDELVDIGELRKRYTYVSAFSAVLTGLKNNRDVIEYEPNQIINISRLEKAGIDKNDLQDFCDMAFEWVKDEKPFSVRSIRADGFDPPLFELGFSDWFYANVLETDERFTSGHFFASIILTKNDEEKLSIQSFLISLIDEYGSIDAYDLIGLLEDKYGCAPPDKSKIQTMLGDSDVYYDKMLDRYYKNQDYYERELDLAEGL